MREREIVRDIRRGRARPNRIEYIYIIFMNNYKERERERYRKRERYMKRER